MVWSVSSSGGNPQKVQDKVSLGWAMSPDSQHLMNVDVSQDGNAEFFLSSPPGSAPRKLPYTVPTTGFVAPEFAPDGRSFVVSTSEGFWRIPFPDGEPRRILEPRKAAYWSWHPDSRHIALARNEGGIQLVDTKTGANFSLLRSAELYTTLHVSPEGSRIAYTSGTSDYDLIELSLDGNTVTPLLASSRIEIGGSWSPKGDQYAYLSVFPEEFRLCLRHPNEDRVTVLYSGSAEALFSKVAFSPDGTRIAFCDGSRVAVIPASGGRAATLASVGPQTLAVGPSWSPDGNSIAFLSGISPAKLMRVDASGSLTTFASDARGGAGNSTAWSADGKWVAYTATDGIRIVAPNGKNSRRLSNSLAQAFAFGPGDRELYRLESTPQGWQLVIQDIASGKERFVATKIPVHNGCRRMSLHPDGKRFLLDLSEQKYDIWMLSGVPQPEQGIARLWRNWRSAPIGERN